MKVISKGQYFSSDVQVDVALYNQSKVNTFFMVGGVQKWTEHFLKCLTLNSDYTEKRFKIEDKFT